jgi:hypothetical protein
MALDGKTPAEAWVLRSKEITTAYTGWKCKQKITNRKLNCLETIYIIMSLLKNKDMYNILTTWAIEKTLLDLGNPIYDKVTEMLKNEYHCYLTDCYEHPEYLNAVLKKLSDDSHVAIVVSITNELKEFLYKEPIRRFVEAIIPIVHEE